MYRLIGALLVLGAMGWMGWSEGAALRKRTAFLRELVGALERMERELTFRLIPLPELFSRLARQTSPPLAAFFAACARHARSSETVFGRAWQEEVQGLSSWLGREALESLSRLGQSLGRCDAEGEGRLLRAAATELREQLARAETESRRLGRLYQTLGLTGGAFLILVLI